MCVQMSMCMSIYVYTFFYVCISRYLYVCVSLQCGEDP